MKVSLFEKLNILPYHKEIAVTDGDTSLTYDELRAHVKKTANALRYLGIKKGDVVTLCLPNTKESVISFYAINAVGAIANIIHPTLPKIKLLQIQEETPSKLLIALPSHKSNAKKITCKGNPDSPSSWESLKQIDAPNIEYNTRDSVAVYLHSGGTTDKPKTIVLSSHNLNSIADGLSELFTPGETVGYRSLTILPTFHAFGLGAGIHNMLNLGMELVLVPKFDKNKTPELIVDKKINMILGVPIVFQAILASNKVRKADDLSHVKNCFVGGDRTPIELITAFNKLLKEKNSTALLCEGYGLTECSSVCSVNRNNAYKAGSIGLPLFNTELAIIDDHGKFLESESIGEICVSGDTVMQRYLSNMNSCIVTKSGKRWLKTGDYGYRDGNGFYYFVERKKRIVKISGVTVFPSEVEMILRTHHAVSDAFVKPSGGENSKLKAFVTLKKGQTATADDLKVYCSSRLMKWAVPESIVFLDTLPLTPIGKIDKKHEIFN